MASAKANGAMARDEWYILKALLDTGVLSKADINQPSGNSGWTLLTYAAKEGRIAVVEQLLFAGADIESKTPSGCTALMNSALSGQLAVAQLLLDKGADIENKDNSGYTALVWSAENGHAAVTKLLLDRGANLDDTDKYGCTALMSSAREGHPAVAKLLLDKGANFEHRDGNGVSVLDHAEDRGHSGVVRLLEEQQQKEKKWRRVSHFVQFLHMSGFASQQWSVRYPDPMQLEILIAAPSSSMKKNCTTTGPVGPIQQRKVLHNRDLCRIITAFIPNTSRF